MPLSSDAFSPFGNEDMKSQNAKVTAAFGQIVVKIHKFVKEFDGERDLVTRLHSYGINIRYLGKVYEIAQSGQVADAVIVEMISRTIKLQIWEKWRSVVKQG